MPGHLQPDQITDRVFSLRKRIIFCAYEKSASNPVPGEQQLALHRHQIRSVLYSFLFFSGTFFSGTFFSGTTAAASGARGRCLTLLSQRRRNPSGVIPHISNGSHRTVISALVAMIHTAVRVYHHCRRHLCHIIYRMRAVACAGAAFDARENIYYGIPKFCHY